MPLASSPAFRNECNAEREARDPERTKPNLTVETWCAGGAPGRARVAAPSLRKASVVPGAL